MRRRPSATMVVALIALVFSLTGTAEAAFLITKNAQVAPHTIAGADASSGVNQNLIPGTVGTKDLHDGAITGAKVAPDSLTGKQINESKLREVPTAATAGQLGQFDPFSGQVFDTVRVFPFETIAQAGGSSPSFTIAVSISPLLLLEGFCEGNSTTPEAVIQLTADPGTRTDTGEGAAQNIVDSNGDPVNLLRYTATGANDQKYFSFNFSATTPDQHHLEGVIHVGVHPQGGDCDLGGFAVFGSQATA